MIEYEPFDTGIIMFMVACVVCTHSHKLLLGIHEKNAQAFINHLVMIEMAMFRRCQVCFVGVLVTLPLSLSKLISNSFSN